jgi:hypothetical protein
MHVHGYQLQENKTRGKAGQVYFLSIVDEHLLCGSKNGPDLAST